MRAQVAGIVAEVIDESMSKVRIKELESDVAHLEERLKTNETKYAADMTEALSTLKQVKNYYVLNTPKFAWNFFCRPLNQTCLRKMLSSKIKAMVH